jgi:hypothetical protein
MDLNQPNTNQIPAPVEPPAVEPLAATEAPPQSAPESTPEPRQPKVLTIPSNAMAQIKREEREKGKKAALAELEARLKKHGFSSVEEMERAAVSKNRPNRSNARPAAQPARSAPREPEAAPAAAAPAGSPDRAMRRIEREREHALEEARRHNTARSIEEKKRKKAEKELAAIQAEMELRTAAVRAGVTDVDYALELLRRSVRGKTAEELKSFDESAFFGKTLRASHPYLYGVVDQPANTVAPEATKRPQPGQQAAPAKQELQQGGPVDARRLTANEYSDLLKRTGIKDPRAGL